MSVQRHGHVMDVFLRAAELDERSREEYLDRVCQDDETLRGEVTSLLRHHHAETILPEHTTPPDRAKLEVQTPLAEAASVNSGSTVGDEIRRLPISFWFLIALFVSILVLATWTHFRIKQSLRTGLRQDLQTVLDADVRALENWVARQQEEVESWADNAQVRDLTQKLVAIREQSPSTAARAPENGPREASADPREATPAELQQRLLAAPEQTQLWELLEPIHGRGEVVGMIVFSRDGVCLVHSRIEAVGARVASAGAAYLGRVVLGESFLIRPLKGHLFANGFSLEETGPLMSVVAPLRDDKGVVVGGLALVVGSDNEYTKILLTAQLGQSGETYAFDSDYLLLSNPRYPQRLVEDGLLEAGAEAALRVAVRVPSTAGELGSSPPTWIVDQAVRNGEALNLEGYLNYRGIPVVGAARWIDAFEFGICSEIEYDEAYAPVRYVDRFSSVLLGLNFFFAAATGFYSFVNVRLRREAGQARRLGAYTLGRLLGEGGMGKVYFARHALLRRPTAVKILAGQQADSQSVARFEREVQLTSQLTHPNTIQIYDFGRSVDGHFYFAMEYLDGPDFAKLIECAGPLPPARAIDLLRQVCGSLKEAHDIGLVHRDIKPANLMICRRGGLFDVAKVLDFGLVKSIVFRDPELTQKGAISGTPAYIAPERVNEGEVDFRSDIFSVGAVAYFLLTGQDAFQGKTLPATLDQVLHADPPPLSLLLSAELPQQLEQLVMRCLAKSPDNRPADLGAVLRTLGELSVAFPWDQDSARAWWHAYEARDKRKLEQPLMGSH